MKQEKIQEVILQNQYHLQHLESRTARELHMEEIPQKASVLIGIRRCGKSTYIRKLLADTIEDKTLICWLDFADDRLVALQNEPPAQIADAYYQLFPDYHEKNVYFFFDEIQLVQDWALFVNRLQNTEKCHIYITGSSARLLSKELATELGGRTLSQELFPFSFNEYLAYHGLETPHEVIANSDKKNALFAQYKKWGGFPEVLHISDEFQKTRYLQNLAMDVITRDIAMRHKIPDLQLLHKFMLMLLGSMGKSVTVNKLRQRLLGMQYKTSAEWISKFLAYFEDAYLIFTLEILSPNAAVRAVNPKKVYCADHALAIASDFKMFDNAGAILENMVFVSLRRKTDEIHYYKTASGYEIDFVTGTEGNLSLYQVCVDLSDEDTLRRELRAIEGACAELNCKTATLITEDEEGSVQLDGCTVEIVRAVDWVRKQEIFR